MAHLLVKRISRFFPFSQHLHPAVPLTPLLRLPLSTQSQQSKEEVPFIAQYLVSSLGFSPERALKISISRKLTAIKSPDRPNALVSFLKEIGLSDLQIRRVISFHPTLLLLSVDDLLKPQALALMDAGFTEELFIQLVVCNPQCLYLKSALKNLQFWRKFVGNNDKTLLGILKYNGLLITCDIDNYIMPRLNLLREHGFSDQQIVKLITWRYSSLLRSIDTFRWILKQTEELGILRGSNLYSYGVQVVSGLTKGRLAKKLNLFKETYSWSEEEVCSAFRKLPAFLSYSEETISSKMDFLIKIAGIESRTIASQARLLSCSIERTLIPRQNVLSVLQAKGIRKGTLLNMCVLPEKRFLECYVVPYEKDIPELAKAYAAAGSRKLPS